MVNLDTHILVALLTGDLSGQERTVLESERWMISDAVLWELANLVHAGRLEMDLHDSDFQEVLKETKIVPISIEIAETSTCLDFESDWVDRVIAATSIVRKVPLLTRAHVLRRSRMTPLIQLI